MATLRKVLVSVGAWLVVTLVTAAVVELSTGRQMPGLVHLVSIVVLMRFWLSVWGIEQSRPVRNAWRVCAVITAALVAWTFATV